MKRKIFAVISTIIVCFSVAGLAFSQIMQQSVVNTSAPVGGGTVATPTFDNDTGSYAATVSVTISDSTSGSTIKYCTAAGSDCSPVGGTTYTVPVVVNVDNNHLCAYATHSGMTDSATKCGTYRMYYTDNFNRTNSTGISNASWTTTTGYASWNILSNQAASNGTGGSYGNYWSANAIGGDQYSQANYTATGTIAHDDMGVTVRVQAGANTFYVLDYGEVSNTFRIYKNVAGSFSQVGTDISHAFSVSEVYKLSASGTTTVTLTMYVNGSSLASRTDSTSTITGGSPGIYTSTENKTPTMDNWQGGGGQ